MRLQASAGRHEFLTPTYCYKLTLTAQTPLETQYLGRLLQEIKDTPMTTLLGRLLDRQSVPEYAVVSGKPPKRNKAAK